MFIGLYCCLLVREQPLSLAWADLHHTDSLWVLFQWPIVKFRLGYPIFYLGTSKFSAQQLLMDPQSLLVGIGCTTQVPNGCHRCVSGSCAASYETQIGLQSSHETQWCMACITHQHAYGKTMVNKGMWMVSLVI